MSYLEFLDVIRCDMGGTIWKLGRRKNGTERVLWACDLSFGHFIPKYTEILQNIYFKIINLFSTCIAASATDSDV